MIFFLFLLITLVFPIELIANECVIKNIEIEGLKKTSPQVVHKAIGVEVGENISVEQLKKIKQDLKNLQIFSNVEVEKKSGCDLVISVNEKWTTIPILKFGSGGGTKYYVLGAYDVNFLGTYQEVGAQYENFQSNDSFVVWYRNPHFAGNKIKIGFDIWNIMREKLVYSTQGKRLGGYTLDRKKLNAFVEYRQNNYLRYGFSLETNQDTLAQNELSDEVKSENITNGIAINQEKSNYVISSLVLKIGEINYDNYLLDGTLLSYTHSSLINKNRDNQYVRNLIELSAFKKVFETDNIAFRYIFADQNNTDQSQVFDVGGLTDIRGYFDGQFRTDKFSVFNLEYRKIIYELSHYAHIQAVAFYDGGTIANNNRLESSGLGLRLISPQIYRFNLRIDYALNVKSENKQSVSLGLQQFF